MRPLYDSPGAITAESEPAEKTTTMSKTLVILLILSSTSVVTFTAGQAPGM